MTVAFAGGLTVVGITLMMAAAHTTTLRVRHWCERRRE